MSSLSDIISAGCPLSSQIGQEFIRMFNLKNFRQLYASSEMGLVTLTPRFLDHVNNIASSGVPLRGVEIKVVDKKTGQQLGPNFHGEIWVKGPQVSPRYLNNIEADQKSFEDGFFKSDDMGYFDGNGLLYVMDRFMELIIYNGFKISPTELESILNSHPSVLESVVIGIKDAEKYQIPKAYVKLKEEYEDQVDEQDLINFVNSQVSNLKRIRGGLEFIDHFPRNAMGKIDRKYIKSLDNIEIL